MDNLEKYIRDNSDQWNDKKAPDGLWNNIEKELDQPKKASRDFKKTIGILAFIIVSAIALYLVIDRSGNSASSIEGVETLQYAELESFKETEEFYLSAIYVNQKALNEKISDASIDEDLKELDQIDKDLREEYQYAQGIYKEDILRALIQNHRTKLNLLQEILDQISEQNQIQSDVF